MRVFGAFGPAMSISRANAMTSKAADRAPENAELVLFSSLEVSAILALALEQRFSCSQV